MAVNAQTVLRTPQLAVNKVDFSQSSGIRTIVVANAAVATAPVPDAATIEANKDAEASQDDHAESAAANASVTAPVPDAAALEA